MTSSKTPRTASRWLVAAPLVIVSAFALTACDRNKPGEPANSTTPAPMTPAPSAPPTPAPEAATGSGTGAGMSSGSATGSTSGAAPSFGGTAHRCGALAFLR
ncbi:MAG: hypothetical protein EOO29_36275 [Comamonadaceae bacterium]|nr:MAG: hypothetical protein EOO29_36275 [Comamonadaceae bacterium]